MLCISVAEALLGSRYRSGSRHFEGVIVQAERVDYSEFYKIEVRDEFNRYRWATIQVYA